MKPQIASLVALLAAAIACTSTGGSESATCDISSPGARQQAVTCGSAISKATAIAAQEQVKVGDPIATLKMYPVAQGESHPTWWVTFGSMTFEPSDGPACTPQSFYVMVDATNGQVIAHDQPSC